MKKLLFIAAASLALASCSSSETTLYSWHDYEDATYQYNKRRTDKLHDKMMSQYSLMTEKQKGVRKTVPPGLYAEYGFALCQSGQREQGLNYLKKEIELYPESRGFIERIIKQFEQ